MHLCEAHKIGIQIQGVYDGVLFWECEQCGTRWHRWNEGTRQHAAAAEHVAAKGDPSRFTPPPRTHAAP